MNKRENELLDLIKSDDRVKFIATLSGGRVLIDAPVALIEEHDDLQKTRGQHPKDVSLLKASIEETGGDSLYPISLFAEKQADGRLRYYCGDGAQRHRALKETEAERTTAQVVLRWANVHDAMRDSMSANFARYEWSDADVFSVIRSKVLTNAEIKSITGFSDSTMDRYETVAPHEWLIDMVSEACFGYAQAAKFIKACNKNGEKLAALKNTLTDLHDQAVANAKHYKDLAASKKLESKEKKKAKVGFWFKGKDWVPYFDALEAEDKEGLEKDADGKWHLVVDKSATTKKSAATIGLTPEWEKFLAVNNFFGRPADEVPLDSYDDVLRRWDDIRGKVQTHRDRLAAAQAREQHPMPSSNPTKDVEPPKGPTKQDPKMTVAPEGDH